MLKQARPKRRAQRFKEVKARSEIHFTCCKGRPYIADIVAGLFRDRWPDIQLEVTHANEIIVSSARDDTEDKMVSLLTHPDIPPLTKLVVIDK